MKRYFVTVCFVLLLFTVCYGEPRVYFSPQDRCNEVLISLIDKSIRTLDIAMFTFTKDDITQAILYGGYYE